MLKFLKIREHHLEMILKWRTHPDVTRFMLTDIEFNMDKQRRWYERIQKDERSRYWVISYSGKEIGVINLADIDKTHRRCSWGFYIGVEESRPVGIFIPPYLYNYVFNVLNMHKVVGEVMDGNANILKIHEMQGCRRVGTQKDQVFKYGKFHDVHLVELMASDWEKQKAKYGKFVAEFES